MALACACAGSGFIIIFAICLYGFAAAFLVSVGTKLEAYRNITQSGASVVAIVLLRYLLVEPCCCMLCCWCSM